MQVLLLLLVALCALLATAVLKVSTPKTKKAGGGLVKMFKSFWLTLIDPSNEENLKSEGGLKKSGKDAKKKGLGIFSKPARKGRKLNE